MVHKKKFPGGITLLFGVLFSLLFVFSSTTCFASFSENDNLYMDYERADYILNFLANNVNYGSGSLTQYAYSQEIFNNFDRNIFCQRWNEIVYNQLTNDELYQWANVSIFSWTNSAGYTNVRFYFSNMTVPNGMNLNYLLVRYYSNYNISFLEYNPDTSTINPSTKNIQTITVQFSSNSITFIEKSSGINSEQTFSTNNNARIAFNLNDTIATVPSFLTFLPTATFYIQNQTTTPTTLKSYFSSNFYIESTEPENPDEPIVDNTTGVITNNSGDTTGKVDLSGIENGITDIKNQISGDTQNIINSISGETQKLLDSLSTVPDMSQTEFDAEDITDNIDFGPINNNPTLNGYTNFWFTLTNGLSGALTGNIRSININFRGEIYTISLDDFSIQLPQQLKFILGMVSTIYFVILIVKWWKIIIDKITGGDIDEVLAMNEEERNY